MRIPGHDHMLNIGNPYEREEDLEERDCDECGALMDCDEDGYFTCPECGAEED